MSPLHTTRQGGAALLGAMLTVALVASLASAALWTQWRQVEIEIAERGRAQSQWLMSGALDWSRLILSEDTRSAQNFDHLGEPWALPVQESKLSTFLSQGQSLQEGDQEVYLSGQISDAQSRLNLASLVEDGKPAPTALRAWVRLFDRLDLPVQELQALLRLWPQAVSAARQSPQGSDTTDSALPSAPLLPQRLEQLTWVGLSTDTIARLRPYVTVLPSPTPVNLNTAPALVLEAVIPGLDAASARQAVQRRNQKPWASLQEAAEALGPAGRLLDDRQHAVRSRFFEIRGRLRLDRTVQDELALVEREGLQVRMLWRVRAVEQTPGAVSLQ